MNIYNINYDFTRTNKLHNLDTNQELYLEVQKIVHTLISNFIKLQCTHLTSQVLELNKRINGVRKNSDSAYLVSIDTFY